MPAFDQKSWDAHMASQAMRGLFANMLRCVRGAGKPMHLLSQMADVIGHMEALDLSIGPAAANDVMLDAMQSWSETKEALLDMREADVGSPEHLQASRNFEREEAYCNVMKGSLQVIASRLVGQSTQESAGETEMSRGINEIFEIRRNRETERFLRESRAPVIRSQPRALSNPSSSDGRVDWLYFITDGTAIKIGVSNEPQKRLRGLQTAHHSKLTIIGTMAGGYQLEGELHARFAGDRMHGEWFRPSAALRDYIEDHAGISAANDNEPQNTTSVQSKSNAC